jgi:hypothetical protein
VAKETARGLSKLNTGRPMSRAGQGNGGGTYWDPQGTLVAKPQRLPTSKGNRAASAWPRG